MKRILPLIFITILSVESSIAALQSDVRKDFLYTMVNGCFASQRAAQGNHGVEDKILYQYCNCSGIYIADHLNNDVVIRIINGDEKLDPQISKISSLYCKKNFYKY